MSDVGDYDVLEAENGEEALAKAKAEKPDLVILDVMMPVKSGFQLFAEPREEEDLQEIPVIMLTGLSGQTGIRVSSSDMGDFTGKAPQAFLEKPLVPATLSSEIKKALGA